MQVREIELIPASLENGRIYFPSTDIKFFPANAMADRETDGHKGDPVVFRAGGETFETDIRISSGQRISPRRDFRRYFKKIGVQAGARRWLRTLGGKFSLQIHFGPSLIIT